MSVDLQPLRILPVRLQPWWSKIIVFSSHVTSNEGKISYSQSREYANYMLIVRGKEKLYFCLFSIIAKEAVSDRPYTRCLDAKPKC